MPQNPQNGSAASGPLLAASQRGRTHNVEREGSVPKQQCGQKRQRQAHRGTHGNGKRQPNKHSSAGTIIAVRQRDLWATCKSRYRSSSPGKPTRRQVSLSQSQNKGTQQVEQRPVVTYRHHPAAESIVHERLGTWQVGWHERQAFARHNSCSQPWRRSIRWP